MKNATKADSLWITKQKDWLVVYKLDLKNLALLIKCLIFLVLNSEKYFCTLIFQTSF